MAEQSNTIIWIPISQEVPGFEPVLTSTKNGTVHILRLHEGLSQQKESAYWTDGIGNAQSNIAFEDVVAWAHLPTPYNPTENFLLEGREIYQEIGVTLMMVQIAEDKINQALAVASAEEGVTMEQLEKMDEARRSGSLTRALRRLGRQVTFPPDLQSFIEKL